MKEVCMQTTELKPVIEALLFASGDPLSPAQLKRLIKTETKEEAPLLPPPENQTDEGEVDPLVQLQERGRQMEGDVSQQEIKQALRELMEDFQSGGRGFELVQIGEGYQFRTRVDLAPYIRNLQKFPKPRLSAPAMETLSVIAYQQPVSRAKIDEIRGVDSGGVIKTLLDRDLVRVVGRSEEAGRPILYGTTPTFLETFSLVSLSELPSLKDLELFDQASQQAPTVVAEGMHKKEVIVEEEKGESYFVNDEESERLVDDLENSMRAIRDLEKRIFPRQKEEEEEGLE